MSMQAAVYAASLPCPRMAARQDQITGLLA